MPDLAREALWHGVCTRLCSTDVAVAIRRHLHAARHQPGSGAERGASLTSVLGAGRGRRDNHLHCSFRVWPVGPPRYEAASVERRTIVQEVSASLSSVSSPMSGIVLQESE